MGSSPPHSIQIDAQYSFLALGRNRGSSVVVKKRTSREEAVFSLRVSEPYVGVGGEIGIRRMSGAVRGAEDRK